jgi:hypothetical protein
MDNKEVEELAESLIEFEKKNCIDCLQIPKDCWECEAQFIISINYQKVEPVQLEVLGEQEREKIAEKPLTDDEVDEIESLATIGLTNDDPYAHNEYENRLRFLQSWVIRRRISQATIDRNEAKGQLYRGIE